jgi:predicted ribosomally synthesized peptide with nif11-like leader
MSLERAKAFIQEVIKSKELSNKLAACANDDERMQLAKSSGFDFTVAEINQAKAESTELSDEALDNVAGGSKDPSCDTAKDWSLCKLKVS